MIQLFPRHYGIVSMMVAAAGGTERNGFHIRRNGCGMPSCRRQWFRQCLRHPLQNFDGTIRSRATNECLEGKVSENLHSLHIRAENRVTLIDCKWQKFEIGFIGSKS